MSYADPNPSLPLGEMNTTPLIDVLLVLLVMMIITIPVATQSVDVELPSEVGPPPPLPKPLQNKIVLTNDGAILWNGKPVQMDEMQAALDITTRMVPEPELQFEPEAFASYAMSALVLRTIKATGVTKFGFVGNERYRDFDRGE